MKCLCILSLKYRLVHLKIDAKRFVRVFLKRDFDSNQMKK